MNKMFFAQNVMNPHDYTTYPTSNWGFNGTVLSIIPIPLSWYGTAGEIMCLGSFTRYVDPTDGVDKFAGGMAILKSDFSLRAVGDFIWDGYVPTVCSCGVVINDYILMGGAFHFNGGNATNCLVKVYPSALGVTYAYFPTGVTGKINSGIPTSVEAMDYANGVVHIVGNFTNVQGDERIGYAALYTSDYSTLNSSGISTALVVSSVRCIKSGGHHCVLLPGEKTNSDFDRITLLRVVAGYVFELCYINNKVEVLSNILNYDGDNVVYGFGEYLTEPNKLVKITVNDDDTMTLNENFSPYGFYDAYVNAILKMNDGNILISFLGTNYKGNGDWCFPLNTITEATFKIDTLGDMVEEFEPDLDVGHVRVLMEITDRRVLGAGIAFETDPQPQKIKRINSITGEVNV